MTKMKEKKAARPNKQGEHNDRTPPRPGDPEQVENVAGREEYRRHGTDPDESYRTGRQGAK